LRSREERRCSILGPTQSRISPSILEYEKIINLAFLQVLRTAEEELFRQAGRMAGDREREFFIDNPLILIHFIIVMIRWTGLASWEFEFPFPGSLTSTFLG